MYFFRHSWNKQCFASFYNLLQNIFFKYHFRVFVFYTCIFFFWEANLSFTLELFNICQHKSVILLLIFVCDALEC